MAEFVCPITTVTIAIVAATPNLFYGVSLGSGPSNVSLPDFRPWEKGVRM